MRIAVVSDIHGNLTALEAVIADLQTIAPDVVVGDCAADRDRRRDRPHPRSGWPGVYGNTDEMLWVDGKADHTSRTSVFIACARSSQNKSRSRSRTSDRTASPGCARCRLMDEPRPGGRSCKPRRRLAITPAEASDEDLAARTVRWRAGAWYGHIHRPFVRQLPGFVLANAGCLSLSYDGDPRAAYAVVDEDAIEIRRVAYDIEREAAALVESQFPYARWMAAILRSAAYIPPPDGPEL